MATLTNLLEFRRLTKSGCVVRSGIRTHAYKSRLRPKRSAYKSLVRKGSNLAKLWTFFPQSRLSLLTRTKA